MSTADDIDAVAAEFVLGSLDAAERGAVIARREREFALDMAIADWERRFGPLAETVPSVTPPADLFDTIAARLDARAAPLKDPPPVPRAVPAAAAPVASSSVPPPLGREAKVIDLRARMQIWRRRAVTLGALAAALVIGLGLREWTRPLTPKSYVAVLQKDASSTAFLLSVNLDTRSFTIRPVTAQPEPGKSFELWLVDSKLGAKSLGVVGDEAVTSRANLSGFDKVTLAGATYAVSVEPAGGSPTGAPTGPVVFTGQLIETTP